MSVNYGLSNIPGLVSAFDLGNKKSYPGSGTVWYDLCNPSLTGPGDPAWANNIVSITISMVLEKLASYTDYAYHPVAKWNGSYLNNASFILYHFGNYLGNNLDGVLAWYGNNTQNVNNGWGGIEGSALTIRMETGKKYHICLQYNSIDGGSLWSNGVKGARGSSGMLGQTILPTNNTTSSISISGPTNPDYEASSVHKVHHIQFYNRELNDKEILLLYNSHKQRFGLT